MNYLGRKIRFWMFYYFLQPYNQIYVRKVLHVNYIMDKDILTFKDPNITTIKCLINNIAI